MNNKLKEAVDVLVEALKTDEGYRIGWQANIAMVFPLRHQLTQKYPPLLSHFHRVLPARNGSR